MKNWKTSLAGVVVAVVGFAIYQGWISNEVGTAVIGLAVALGFVASSDSGTYKNISSIIGVLVYTFLLK